MAFLTVFNPILFCFFQVAELFPGTGTAAPLTSRLPAACAPLARWVRRTDDGAGGEGSFAVDPESLTTVAMLKAVRHPRHHFGAISHAFLTHFSVHHPACAVAYALPSVHAYRVLIGARSPMLRPIRNFRRHWSGPRSPGRPARPRTPPSRRARNNAMHMPGQGEKEGGLCSGSRVRELGLGVGLCVMWGGLQ